VRPARVGCGLSGPMGKRGGGGLSVTARRPRPGNSCALRAHELRRARLRLAVTTGPARATSPARPPGRRAGGQETKTRNAERESDGAVNGSGGFRAGSTAQRTSAGSSTRRVRWAAWLRAGGVRCDPGACAVIRAGVRWNLEPAYMATCDMRTAPASAWNLWERQGMPLPCGGLGEKQTCADSKAGAVLGVAARPSIPRGAFIGPWPLAPLRAHSEHQVPSPARSLSFPSVREVTKRVGIRSVDCHVRLHSGQASADTLKRRTLAATRRSR